MIHADSEVHLAASIRSKISGNEAGVPRAETDMVEIGK